MNRYIIYKIDFRLLLWLIFAFIIATIVGTVSHEYGHYLTFQLAGVDAKVHYASTSLIIPDDFDGIISRKDAFLMTLGGPLQTIFTGSIGLFLLYFYRKKIILLEKLNMIHWFYIFLTLFWLRQTANFVLWTTKYLTHRYLSQQMDEVKLALHLGIPEWSIIFPTAILGFVITIYVIFGYIPIKQRFTFIVSGLIGGVLGFYLWLVLFGKIIMP